LLMRKAAPGLGSMKETVRQLLASGELERGEMSGETYLWPASRRARALEEEPAREVRFLAPFDPIVWDRRRFELLWGREYRCEAYTPQKRRRFGYYAMPLLWGEQVIGWANVAATAHGIDVDIGTVNARPKGRDFRRALDAEIARMQAFLGKPT